MKKFLYPFIPLTTVCWLLFLFLFPHKPVYASEAILNFNSTIVVAPDASITVTEEIRARCLGRNISHGIYRDIPVKYRRSDGSVINSRFKILDIKMDGHAAEYHTSNELDNIRIYIGSSNRLLPHGVHSFQITYRMERMVGFFDNYDELYWNVTGNQWQFPIEEATCQIILPEKTRFLQFASYTGRFGSKQNKAKVTEKIPGSITFATTAPLATGEGLTVAVAWPAGIVKRPTSSEKAIFFLRDNLSFAMGLLGLMASFIYFFLTWKKVGKDPEKGTIIPRFEPPKQFGPAAARYIMKMGFDNHCFTAAVINLAVKGYLKIKEEKGKFTLIRKREGEKGALSEGEKRLFGRLFYNTDELEIRAGKSRELKSAIQALKNSLKAHFERIYFLTNTRQLVPGLVLSVLTLVLIAAGSPDPFSAGFMSLWLSGWSGFTAFLVYTAYVGLREVVRSKSAGTLKKVIAPVLFSIPFTIFWFVGCAFYGKLAGFHCLAIFLILIAMNIAFYQLMKAPTMKGRKIMDQLEGFRLFLKTAEKERLQQLIPPGKAPEFFEKYLPWAVALDVGNQWGEKFSQYLSEAEPREGGYAPMWYTGTHFTPTALSSSLGSGLTSSVTGATFTGGSSGSGGGGFSGGGGGGGGGGGW